MNINENTYYNTYILPSGILNFLDDYERETELIEQQMMYYHMMMWNMYYNYNYSNFNY